MDKYAVKMCYGQPELKFAEYFQGLVDRTDVFFSDSDADFMIESVTRRLLLTSALLSSVACEIC